MQKITINNYATALRDMTIPFSKIHKGDLVFIHDFSYRRGGNYIEFGVQEVKHTVEHFEDGILKVFEDGHPRSGVVYELGFQASKTIEIDKDGQVEMQNFFSFKYSITNDIKYINLISSKVKPAFSLKPTLSNHRKERKKKNKAASKSRKKNLRKNSKK